MEVWRRELYLQHHGIKGMHWGIRRFQNADGSLTSAGRKRYLDNWSEDAKIAHELKRKKVSEMTNTELKKLNERRNLEKQYKDLNPSKVTKIIKTMVAGALGTVSLLYNNYNQVIKAGKGVAKSFDDMRMKDIDNAFKAFRVD